MSSENGDVFTIADPNLQLDQLKRSSTRGGYARTRLEPAGFRAERRPIPGETSTIPTAKRPQPEAVGKPDGFEPIPFSCV